MSEEKHLENEFCVMMGHPGNFRFSQIVNKHQWHSFSCDGETKFQGQTNPLPGYICQRKGNFKIKRKIKSTI